MLTVQVLGNAYLVLKNLQCRDDTGLNIQKVRILLIGNSGRSINFNLFTNSFLNRTSCVHCKFLCIFRTLIKKQ